MYGKISRAVMNCLCPAAKNVVELVSRSWLSRTCLNGYEIGYSKDQALYKNLYWIGLHGILVCGQAFRAVIQWRLSAMKV